MKKLWQDYLDDLTDIWFSLNLGINWPYAGALLTYFAAFFAIASAFAYTLLRLL